ncbi:MAG: hypothetical protein J6Y02_21000 [Pseudobutyrivibrio sp.]|nr:hypothetical protein [Pseudobutyrivibrio sp.]
MKRLFDWFTNKYDIFDDETGEWKVVNDLFLADPPAEKGRGFRIIIRHNDPEDTMSYIQDLFEGKDYGPDDDIFEVITKAIDEIMEVMPK